MSEGLPVTKTYIKIHDILSSFSPSPKHLYVYKKEIFWIHGTYFEYQFTFMNKFESPNIIDATFPTKETSFRYTNAKRFR